MDDTVTKTGSVPEEPDFEIPQAGTEEYTHWQKTGQLELPDKPEEKKPEEKVEKSEKPEESAASPSEAKKPKPATGPEPVQPKKKTAEARLQELLAERKQREKAWEEERARLLRQISEPREAKPAESVTAKPAEKKEAGAKKRPEPTDKDEKGEVKYKTWGDYERAYQDWAFEEATRQALAKVDERLANSDKTQREQARDLHLKQTFTAKSNEARKKYADFDKVALNPETPIPHGSELEAFILESDQGADLAYYFGQNREEAERLSGWQYVGRNAAGEPNFQKISEGLSGRALIRELTLLELSLLPDEGEEVQPKPKPKSFLKPVTAAPKPVHQVTGTSASNRDEAEDALENEDTAGYINIMNARDIARKKSRR